MTARIGRKMIDREPLAATSLQQFVRELARWMLRTLAIVLVSCAVLIVALS
jgi:hypothetical protein